MLLICAGIAIRSLPSPPFLFGGTTLIGCGIALGNVLLPGLIKRDFSQHVAKLTGAYSLTMGAAAAIGSAIVVPLALNGFGWRGALMMLMVFPLLALFIWLPQYRQTSHATMSNSRALHSRGIWRSSLAWQVTLFLGINSLVYYVIIGWLPAILISHGYSEAQAGSLHGLLQLATAAPGLLIPLILFKLKDQRAIAALVSLMCAIAAAGFWLLPNQSRVMDDFIWLWLGRDDDPRTDVHRTSCQFCAPGGCAIRYGAVCGVLAGGVWTAVNGQNSRPQR